IELAWKPPLCAQFKKATRLLPPLFCSRYQKHDRIIAICEELAARHSLDFFYEDWRTLWQEGIRLSKAAGMYRQQYCGCIFSEEERYREQIHRDRR
ncbi:MAG: epoxyqueuosine reductase QueH, partial [Candidatus Cloacimonetes bacterium]|nr:epoxyqueuosine reductase QueH [Candidatus Cloacimonadota bacterium]